MKVLGIDTSAIVCSVAIISDDLVLSERTVSDGLTHSETLLPLIKEVLSVANLKLSDLDGIAISHGPGSFTGLRIGISTVKGLAVTHNIPCIGVSTLEALAMNMIMTEGATVCSLMDARRGEFYNGIFRVEKNQLIRISEDRAIPGSKIAEELTSFEKVYLLGDGALKFAGQFAQFSDCLVDETLRFQSGKCVARLGLSLLRGSEAISCKELSPKYLRLPQAEREWNEKNKNS